MRLEALFDPCDVWGVLLDDARRRVIDELAGAIAWREAQRVRAVAAAEIRPLQKQLKAAEAQLPKLEAAMDKARAHLEKASGIYQGAVSRSGSDVEVRGTKADQNLNEAARDYSAAERAHADAAEVARKARARLAQLEPLAARLEAIRKPELALLKELGIG